MTSTATKPRRARPSRRRWILIVGALVLAVVLSGCGGVVGSMISTQRDLQSAGFSSVSVRPEADNDLRVTATQDGSPADAAAVSEIQSIVWREFHQRFGSLRVELHGSGPTAEVTLSFAQLQGKFGARSAAWNRQTIVQSLQHTGLEIVVALVVALAVAVVVIVLVVRRRRAGPAASGAVRYGVSGGGQPGGAPYSIRPPGRRRPSPGAGRAPYTPGRPYSGPAEGSSDAGPRRGVPGQPPAEWPTPAGSEGGDRSGDSVWSHAADDGEPWGPSADAGREGER